MPLRVLTFCLVILSSWAWADDRPNVLFIAVDDLRDELGCYGASHIHSPHIDRLAARGIRFTRAYVQQALCGPSRNSVFSGARPDTTRVFNGKTHFREALPDIVSLPQLFKEHGYYTRSLGKILHHNGQDDPDAFTEPRFFPTKGIYAHPENTGRRIVMDQSQENRNPLTERADVPDHAYRDGMVADEAVKTLRQVKDRPFMLMVGFFKPHTPFNAPAKYWDLYDPEQLDLAPNAFAPAGVPDLAMSGFNYVRSFSDFPDELPVPDDVARRTKHAYYACVSFVDAQVGRVLDELKRLGLDKNTVVVLWSDHGYQLGEHGMWCKHTNFETSTRAPMILSVPGQRKGLVSDALVEMVDIYPTLAEAAGLPLPDHLEGTSLLPLLKDPSRPWKKAAFSQYQRGKVMGRSVRTDRYRYNEWRQNDGRLIARELYDHAGDPYENFNLAVLDGSREVMERLSAELKAGWKAARPHQ